ncbi:hypothetical protein CRYUN_Cryun11dG0015300 [Craigia yunnanensis]
MLMSRALSRVSRSVDARSLLLSAPKKLQTPNFSTQFHSLVCESPNKLVTSDVSLLHHSNLNFSAFQRFGISSSASPEPTEKQHGSDVENHGQEPTKPSGDTNPREAEVTDQAKESGFNSESQNTMPQSDKRRRKATKRTAFSDSDSESDDDLSMADMVKIVEEKEGLLKAKQKEIEQMQDKVVRTLAEMENVMVRTRREAENSKKFAIQNFAKSLLDVADNLGRASTHVKGSFSTIDESKVTVGAVALLKTLLEGAGYMLYDRVIRPAEVGVTQAPDNDAAENNTSDKGSDA